MKKIALLGLIVALTGGCGRNWLPFFRGAPCRGTCGVAPAMPAAYDAGCGTCAPGGAGYGSYDGEVMGSGGYASDYYGGEVIDGGYAPSGVIEGTIVNPMTPITPAS